MIVGIPLTLTAHFLKPTVQLEAQSMRHPGGRWWAVRNAALAFWYGIVAAFKVLLALALSPVLILVLVLLLGLQLLPYRIATSASAAVQRAIAQIIGDSFVFLSSPVRKSAILSKVRRDLQWLVKEGCDHVIVIAHSQGGAIAHRTMQLSRVAEVKLLVTYGSGLEKLSQLENVFRVGGRTHLPAVLIWLIGLAAGHFLLLGRFAFDGLRITACAMLSGLFLSSLANATYRFRVGHLRSRIWLIVLIHSLALYPPMLLIQDLIVAPGAFGNMAAFLIMTVLAFGFMVAAGRFGLRSVSADEDEGASRVGSLAVTWHDIFTSRDPVPNGELLEQTLGPAPIDSSIEVNNRGSRLADHTAYWSNQDEFTSLIIERAVGHATGLQILSQHELVRRTDEARKKRRLRVGSLVWLRRLLASAAIVIASVFLFRVQELSPLVESAAYAADAVPWFGSHLGGAIRKNNLLSGGIGIVAIAAGLYLVLFTAWRAWDRSAIDAFLTDKQPRPFTAALFLLLSLGCLALFCIAAYWLASAATQATS